MKGTKSRPLQRFYCMSTLARRGTLESLKWLIVHESRDWSIIAPRFR